MITSMMSYKLAGGKRGRILNDKAMCNRGPDRQRCKARHMLEKQMGCYLTCELLNPHNGPHHDTYYRVYWREDLARSGWKDGKRPNWMRRENYK